jgi:Arc/MetJ-type ribon-helix-helix transcriptional regulator
MAQLVTRIDDEMARQLDELLETGAVASRSEAVRQGLEILFETHRRRRIGESIVEGYRRVPEGVGPDQWSDKATAAMIAEESW